VKSTKQKASAKAKPKTSAKAPAPKSASKKTAVAAKPVAKNWPGLGPKTVWVSG
jgi:hypothetical protein